MRVTTTGAAEPGGWTNTNGGSPPLPKRSSLRSALLRTSYLLHLLERFPDEPREAGEAARWQAKEAVREAVCGDPVYSPKPPFHSKSLRASIRQKWAFPRRE